MPVGAKVDKSGFQAGFYSSNSSFIYVGFGLHSLPILNIEIVQFLSINHGHAHFFSLRCVN